MPDIVIPNAGTDSQSLNWDTDYFDAESITIFSPTFAEVLSFQGSIDGTTWFTINDTTNTAVKVPAQNAVVCYNGIFSGFNYIRIHSGSGVASSRTFQICKSWRA